jgi:hypothetical protein
MRVISLMEQEQARGFSHLIILRFSSVTADNDFNVAATTTAINAIPLGAGDVVNYPLAQVFCKTVPTGLTAPTCSVGVTGAAAGLVASGALAAGRSLMSVGPAATAGGPFESDGTAKFVTVTLAATNNLNAATAGEVHVYVNVSRAADLAKVVG